MPSKIETILDHVKQTAGEESYRQLIAVCGVLDEKPTPAKQAKYATALLENMTQICGNTTTAAVMQMCGHSCISQKVIDTAKKLYNQSEDMTAFLEKLNAQHIGGGYLHIQDDKIIGVYDRCYCGLAKAAKGLSGDYCNCSAGWFEKLFSCVLDKKVSAKKLETILDGGRQCRFEISETA